MTCRKVKFRTALGLYPDFGAIRIVNVGNTSILGMLSIGLVACSPTGTSQDVAKGNNFSVSSGELDQAMQAIPPVPKNMLQSTRRNVLSRLIQEKLLANEAVSEQLDRDPRVLAEVEAAKRAVLAQAYAAELTGAIRAPSDVDIKTFYDQHPEAFSQRVSVEMDEVVFAGPTELANKFAKQLDGGTPVAKLRADAAPAGVHVSAGHVVTTSDKLPAALAKQIARVAVGSNVIFPAQDGVIFARILAVEPAPLELEQATPIIRNGMQMMSKNDLLNKEIARLRTKAGITYTDPALAFPATKP